jgi:hypothetical protein
MQKTRRARRLLEQCSGVHSLAARSGSTPNGGEFDYSSLAGFRIARTLP